MLPVAAGIAITVLALHYIPEMAGRHGALRLDWW